MTSAACTSVACPLPPRRFHFAFDGDAAAGRKMLDFGFVVRQLAVGDDLDIRQAGAVVQFQKAEAALANRAACESSLAALMPIAGLSAANADRFHCPP